MKRVTNLYLVQLLFPFPARITYHPLNDSSERVDHGFSDKCQLGAGLFERFDHVQEVWMAEFGEGRGLSCEEVSLGGRRRCEQSCVEIC
jgi:hypothetical protein